MDLQHFRELGLSDGQIKVYGAVLELGISTLNSIHEKTGIDRRNIYDILNKLIERGMISYTVEKGRRTYQCTPPEKVREEIKRKEQALHALEQQIPDLRELYAAAKPEIRAEVYRGNEAIKSFLNDILRYRESYWLGGNSFERYTAVPKSFHVWFEHWMKKRAERKHLMHDLVSYGTSLRGLESQQNGKHKKMHYKYCSLPKNLYSPMVVIIAGDMVAQVLWGKQSFAFVMESKKIRDSFMKYFEYFWRDPW